MIISQTPYRVSFAGGGTDLPAFYTQESGAVLPAVINQHMYDTVSPRFDASTRVAYTKTEIADTVNEVQHTILREALKQTGLEKHIEITTIGDVPSGTSFGSSNRLSVGLPNALYAYKGELITNPAKLAEQVCRLGGGGFLLVMAQVEKHTAIRKKLGHPRELPFKIDR